MQASSVKKATSDFLEQFKNAAIEGADLIGIDSGELNESKIHKIDEFMFNPPDTGVLRGKDSWVDISLPVGSLWGELMVDEFGWDWLDVELDDGTKVYGVFSKDRSLCIYPWHFVFAIIERNSEVTIELAWNMLVEGKIPAQPENGYLNIMNNIYHVVPR